MTPRASTCCSLASIIFLTVAVCANAATVTVAWDANPNAYISGYVVSYGTQSGQYSTHVDVGAQSSRQFTNLLDGVTYYFIVQSYDSNGLLSVPSQEVSTNPLTTTTTAPTIACPIPSATSSDGGAVAVTFSPLVSGGTAPVTSSCTPASGSMFPVGSTAFTCIATDAIQRTASCDSAVIVTSAAPAPTPAPPATLTITCPVIASVVANNGRFANVSYPSPVVSGGVAPIQTSCTPSSGSQFQVGSTPVTCRASDAVQQVASCTTTVTVTTSSGTTPSPSPSPNDVTLTGTISNLNGRCPSVTFTVGGQQVTTSASTNYTQGSCGALNNGKNVEVRGLLQANGSIAAIAVAFHQ